MTKRILVKQGDQIAYDRDRLIALIQAGTVRADAPASIDDGRTWLTVASALERTNGPGTGTYRRPAGVPDQPKLRRTPIWVWIAAAVVGIAIIVALLPKRSSTAGAPSPLVPGTQAIVTLPKMDVRSTEDFIVYIMRKLRPEQVPLAAKTYPKFAADTVRFREPTHTYCLELAPYWDIKDVDTYGSINTIVHGLSNIGAYRTEWSRQLEAIKILADRGADLDNTVLMYSDDKPSNVDISGCPPLYYAIIRDDIQLVQYLLDKKATWQTGATAALLSGLFTDTTKGIDMRHVLMDHGITLEAVNQWRKENSGPNVR